jgi:hypothetical protein
MRSLSAALLLAAAGVAYVPAAQGAGTLADTRQLLDAGAPRLALDRIDHAAPADRSAATWSAWEGLRCAALSALHRDAEVLERVARLAEEARPSPVLAPCVTAAAHAFAALEKHDDARRYAARALWDFKLPPRDVEGLRRLVIDTYVAGEQGDEAYRAMLRFQQDYGPLPKPLLARFVTALLDLGKDREALTWLAQLDDTQPAKLALRVRAGLVDRGAALRQAQAALAKGGGAGYWRVVLDAAADAMPGVKLAAREHLLDGEPRKSQAQALWSAYLAAAEASANRERLLVGDDAGWARVATRLLPNDAGLGRAFLAYLAQRGASAAVRRDAQLRLLASLAGDHLERAAVLLFQHAFPDLDALDNDVRYRLGAAAEAGGDARYAMRVWRDLAPAADADAAMWRLRLARVRWRADRRDAGADQLAGELRSRSRSPHELVQETARYATELDEAGQHAAASRLFEAALPQAEAADARVLGLALARAYEGAGEYARAADAYLRVALAPDPPDRPALQARLQAAGALARAGYAQDARAQLEWLVVNAKDPHIVDAARDALKRR